MTVVVRKVADKTALIDAAAHDFFEVVSAVGAEGGVHGDGVARIVLTGGGAGIGLLKKLAELDYAAVHQADSFPIARIDWSKIHVFFGDERNVPVGDPESNEGQAREALLDHVEIPAESIHSYKLGELSMDESVAHYTAELAEYAPKGFDLHLLGMGGEGHINSLFPDTDAVKEQDKLVLAVTDSPKLPAERITLTLPAVAQADRVWLLVSGSEKAEAAGHVARGAAPVDWPAAGAHGRKETVLFVSEDAASEI